MKNEKLTVEDYAIASVEDIGCEKFRRVEDGKVNAYYAGTVYGHMVGTAKGMKFDTKAEACDNALLFIDECVAAVQEKLRGAE